MRAALSPAPVKHLATALCTLAISLGAALGQSSFIIVDNQTGHILASRGASERRQIGSVTKMATALVILDMAELHKLRLSEPVTISSRALEAGGINPVGLAEGDTLTIRDLLYCILLASDNVAAEALAEHAGARLPNPQGLAPAANFVAHMNALARSLNMRRTLFLNPSGLDAPTGGTLPHSTAADVARLTRYAYSDPDFPYYVSQRSREIRIQRGGQDLPVLLQNTNTLLGEMGIDGVKTGRTARAGDCIVLSSERKPEARREGTTILVTPRRIHIVLLGSRDRVAEGRELTRRGWALYDQWAAGGRKTSRRQTL